MSVVKTNWGHYLLNKITLAKIEIIYNFMVLFKLKI